MKTAIVTWHAYRNYGSALQSVALSMVLKKFGTEPYLVNYEHKVDICSLPIRGCGLRGLFLYSFRIIKNLFRNFFTEHNQQDKTISLIEYLPLDKEKKFDEFILGNVKLTEFCKTLSDFENLNNDFSAFVCGSDQIWAPIVFSPRYFLDFVKDKRKKIAYAPSIGLNEIANPDICDRMGNLIGDIAYLSVREKSGCKLLERLYGYHAEFVLDPTLLLTVDEWIASCKLTLNNGPEYALVYMLGNNPEHWHSITETAKSLNLTLKIIPVWEKDLLLDGCEKNAVGPKDFLNLLLNAKIVFSDSFHCLIFSILFHRPFCIFERFREKDENNQNSRIYSLLDLLEIKKCLATNNEIVQKICYPDFDKIDKLLAESRIKSLSYLHNALLDISSIERKTEKHILYNNVLCCGCGACAKICSHNAINIKMNGDGFFRALINKSLCINCGRCISVCPFEGKIFSNEQISPELFSFKSYWDSVLLKSSSGGAAYSICKFLIEKKYRIIGCTYDEEKHIAKHITIDKIEDLYKLQGSKYIQSEFSSALAECFDSNSAYAIIGTPCQIAAARKLLHERNDIIYIDLVCHGVPTYHLFWKYRRFLAEKFGMVIDKIVTIFRYKPKGWRVIHLYSSDGDKSVVFDQKEDYFFRMFEHGLCYNRTCYECRWRDCSNADIRLADYWGPHFVSDLTGVSMVIAFTKKGRSLIEKIKTKKYGELKQQDIQEYIRYQQQYNLPEPVFYQQLLNSLKGKSSLEYISEKYVIPFEHVKRPLYQRIMYIFRSFFMRGV